MATSLKSMQDKAAHQQRCREAAVKAYSALTPKEQDTADLLHLMVNEKMTHGAPAPIFSQMAKAMHDRDLRIKHCGVEATENEALLEQIGKLYGRNVSLKKGHATLTARVQELEAQLKEQKTKSTTHINDNDNGVEIGDAEGNVTVRMGETGGNTAKTFEVSNCKVFINDAIIGQGTIRSNCSGRPGDYIRKMMAKLQGSDQRALRLAAEDALQRLATAIDRQAVSRNAIQKAVQKTVDEIKDELKDKTPISFADTTLQKDIENLRGSMDYLHTRLLHVEARMPIEKQIGEVVHETVERMMQPGGLLHTAIKLK